MNPTTTLDARFSNQGATPTDWEDGLRRIESSEVFWLSTVRPDGRPHVTPLISVWVDGAACFCTGPSERKARNLAQNSHCVLTTGCNLLHEGLDVTIEGQAVQVSESSKLERIAAAYESKYGPGWHFDIRDGMFQGNGGPALVFEVAPETIFGFGKGLYSQTRWRFQRND